MRADEAQEILRKSRLFRDLDDSFVADLSHAVRAVELKSGEDLFCEGAPSDSLYLVLNGELEACVAQNGGQQRLGDLRPGEPVGELGVLFGGPRTATVKAVKPSRLLAIEAQTLRECLPQAPQLEAALEAEARARIQRNDLDQIVERFFGNLDQVERDELAARLEWVRLDAGEILFRRWDPGDSLFFIVDGSLWAVAANEYGEEVPIASLGQGEVVGEMGLLSGESRSAGVVAARESTLVRLSRTNFELLNREYPALVMGITRQLADRLRRSQRKQPAARGGCRRIAVIAANPDRNPTALMRAISAAIGPSAEVLDVERVRRLQGQGDGPGADSIMAEAGIGLMLDEMAASREILFQITEPLKGGEASAWTRRCLNQADELLIVADGNADREPNGLERALYEDRRRTTELRSQPRTRLLLTHENGMRRVRDTSPWLKARSPDGHFHLRLGDDEDLARVARLLAGRAVGLALGGAGPGGLGQVGAIQALEEAGIPLDMIAASGVGAVVGAGYAFGLSGRELAEVDWQRHLPGRHASGWPELETTDIEDLWRPFVCVSTNLNKQTLSIHRQGNLWDSVAASSIVPGLGSPVSLDGDLHVSGSLINRLPGDLLRGVVGSCIGIDTMNGQPDHVEIDFGSLSQPWWRRLLPGWSRQVSVAPDLLLRSLFAGSHRGIRETKRQLDVDISLASERGFNVKVDPADVIRDAYQETCQYIDRVGVQELRARLALD